LSRRCWSVLAALSLLPGVNAPAQDAPDATTAEVMARARAAVGPVSPEQRRRQCAAQDKQGDIVVCAPGDDKEFRVKSSSELDPNSRQATRTGVPRAPDLAPKYPGVAVMKACFIPPCPKPPMYMIDLSSIKETPKGSDAEKVANGEMSDR
jgi:hypothetical protein